MPKLNINDLYKRRVNELVSGDTKELDRIEQEFNRKWTEEEWFSQLKRRWYFHELSWYMLEETERYTKKCDHEMVELSYVDNPYFCTPIHGCLEDCFYHGEEGKIEYSRIQKAIEDFNHFPGLLEARKKLEEEKAKAQEGLKEFNKRVVDDPLAIPKSTERKKHSIFKLLEGKLFWIWPHKHLHLQEFLMTQGKCCFNHIIGEPKKHGALMPIW